MLPKSHLALVERGKIVEYLLNPEHRYGANKARFFAEFGFEIQGWETLAEVLREHGRSHEVSNTRQTRWGPRYEIDGELKDARWSATPHSYRLATRRRRDCAPAHHGLSFGGRHMIKEHDIVVLTEDMPAEGLTAGDVGTVVHIHNQGEGYEVEFVTLGGQTIAVASLLARQVRPVNKQDISHVRELQPA